VAPPGQVTGGLLALARLESSIAASVGYGSDAAFNFRVQADNRSKPRGAID
jgi:hypothetical protein